MDLAVTIHCIVIKVYFQITSRSIQADYSLSLLSGHVCMMDCYNSICAIVLLIILCTKAGIFAIVFQTCSKSLHDLTENTSMSNVLPKSGSFNNRFIIMEEVAPLNTNLTDNTQGKLSKRQAHLLHLTEFCVMESLASILLRCISIFYNGGSAKNAFGARS